MSFKQVGGQQNITIPKFTIGYFVSVTLYFGPCDLKLPPFSKQNNTAHLKKSGDKFQMLWGRSKSS